MKPSFLQTRQLVLHCVIGMTMFSCAQPEQSVSQQVQSTFEGTLTIRPEIDLSTDYSGFEVLVAGDNAGEPDTLGYAVTDSTGYFSMQVNAPERGVYRLVMSRLGQIQATGQIAIADGDSASMMARFPLQGQNIRIRSEENSSLQAYQNIRTQHEQALVKFVQSETYEEEQVRNQVQQTTMILWTLQQTFPNTMGSELAAAEAISMGTGWEDSVVVARMNQLPITNPRYANAVRAARQSEARQNGQLASLRLLETLYDRVESDLLRAEIASEKVIAHMDSMEFETALSEAHAMQDEFGQTQWAIWAERAAYEIEHLLPGMEAPAFFVRDAKGDSLQLEDLRGKHVLLEFYRPEDDLYQRELPGRNDLFETLGGGQLEIVSFSMQADTLVNEGFFEERVVPGRHVYGATEVSELYNINVLPTRFLIDPNGTLVDKYIGGTMAAIYEYMINL